MAMKIRFTKMQALGNDFVVIDAIRQEAALDEARLRRLADRRLGVGCDQVLLVAPPTSHEADFRYRIFNADGGEVEQCGNGARCFARFVRETGLSDKETLRVETAGGLITLHHESEGRVRVNMGAPRFDPESIPFVAEGPEEKYALEVGDEPVTIGIASMGNPHAVLRVAEVESAPVERLGPAIEHHPRFPQRVNVGFMQVVTRDRIRLRVHERAAGETPACGTGACAAVAVGRRWGLLDEAVEVELPGGLLTIRWAGDDTPIWMSGPAQQVFEGTITL